MKNTLFLIVCSFALFSCSNNKGLNLSSSEITKWKDDKNAAISITYDDGIINQFTVARPIMNELGMKGTFYVITGKIPGSGKGKFIGRPINEIIAETSSIPTTEDNFFERASAIAYTGVKDAVGYHSGAGSLFERGKIKEAYALIDRGYSRIRNNETLDTGEYIFHVNDVDTTTWADLQSYAEEGHEIASHTVTHARLAVLDEANMRYELEQSKKDILENMGEAYTFTAECPYGTEDERVMEIAHQLYPALRNRMPEPYLEELNRASKVSPTASDKEYVQWQRGPLTDFSMELMKSWVDTCVANENIWLVLVFHGINGIGWESKKGEELKEYFTYMKEKESALWIETFANVTKYVRIRKNTKIINTIRNGKIHLQLESDLDNETYNIPVTIKTYLPENWNKAKLSYKSSAKNIVLDRVLNDARGNYVLHELDLTNNTVSISSP